VESSRRLAALPSARGARGYWRLGAASSPVNRPDQDYGDADLSQVR
jgi:hypothetical protein